MNGQRTINSTNFNGRDRRNGNGRVKLSTRDWYLILTVIIGTTLWLGKLQWNANAQEIKIAKVEKAPQDIALIKKDIGHIQGDVSGLKADVGEIKSDIKLILQKLPN